MQGFSLRLCDFYKHKTFLIKKVLPKYSTIIKTFFWSQPFTHWISGCIRDSNLPLHCVVDIVDSWSNVTRFIERSYLLFESWFQQTWWSCRMFHSVCFYFWTKKRSQYVKFQWFFIWAKQLLWAWENKLNLFH